MNTIPLMKNTFLQERETKERLSRFILSSERLSMGEKCLEFEAEFARYQGRKHAILFNSGGSANLALLQALKNLGQLRDGDAIAFSALTWSTNVMPILQLGMKPVPVDCEPRTLNSMSKNLEALLKQEKIKAFFITNALGFTGDLAAIRELCRKNDVLLLEDNCESLGTELPEGKAGNFGRAATFSFFVAHHMSTIEGGMIATDDAELDEMLRIVRANGWDRNLSPEQQSKLRREHGIKSEFEARYTFYDLGGNTRPTEITGFLGLEQLRYLEENCEARQKNYLALERELIENDDFLAPEHSHISFLSNFSVPVMCRTPELRERHLKRFMDSGVEVRPIIAGNIQRQPFFRKYVEEQRPLPGADFLQDCGFYFGNYPELTESDIEKLKECLKR